MRLPNFSMRALLVAVTVMAIAMALSVRFGPHVLWKTIYRKNSSGTISIPTQPLVDEDPNEELVGCRLGPIFFEIPRSFTDEVEFQAGKLHFRNGEEQVILALPGHANMPNLAEFPEKAKLTQPQLFREVWDAQSSDFSFSMSVRELRWHQWMLRLRSPGPNTFVSSAEFSWGTDLDGILGIGDHGATFQWSSTDSKWDGTVYFPRPTEENLDWIRHLCATLSIDGDLSGLRRLTAAELKTQLRFAYSSGATPLQRSQ